MTTRIRPQVEAPPALVARVDGRSVALRPVALALDVVIAGTVAATTARLTFENAHEHDLEGEIVFPLPPGAALSGYGLDIEGEIVPASLVEKARARKIFEAEIRKQVDPGLMEQVGANVFRTRIWPVPAGGRRTIEVKIVTTLEARDDDDVYRLPLRFEAPQRDVSEEQDRRFAAWTDFLGSGESSEAPEDAFRLRVTVAKSGRPDIPDAAALGFEDHGDSWVAETRRAEYLPASVRIGLPRVAETTATVDRSESEGEFFVVDARVEDPEPVTAISPGRVAVVWDASLSRALADAQFEFDLLRGLLHSWESVEVDLVLLRNTREVPRRFTVVAGDGEAILEAIAEAPHDGGTRLADITIPDGCDLAIVFTDGVATLGDPLPPVPGTPTWFVSSDDAANRPLLAHLAGASGGEHVDLRRAALDRAMATVGSESVRLLGIDAGEGEIDAVSPSGPVVDGRIEIVGRLLAATAEVTLRFGHGDREVTRRTVRLSREGAGTTGLVGRLWAQRRVDALGLDATRHRAELLDLGRRFGIVTPNASLLVLETLEQHLEHGIPPAPEREAMREEYDRCVAGERHEEAERREAKLDRVLGWWEQRVEWWEREFDPMPPPVDGTGEDDAEEHVHARMAYGAALAADAFEGDARPLGDATQGQEVMFFCGAPEPASAGGSLDESPDEPAGAAAAIAVAPWDPDTPYLRAMRDAGEDGAYAAYLAGREGHGRGPSFYLDCADHLFRIGQRDLAVRVLSSVTELDLESPALLRVVGYKLESEGELDLAAEVLGAVLAMRPDEPQSHRDLALVLDRRGDFRLAAELLWTVVTGDWDERFPEIETIALLELNRLLERARVAGNPDLAGDLNIDPRLVRLLDHDLRIVLAWDADDTDVDLWVTEPTGEKCYYSNNRTRIGGRISRDFTQGYGPEEYVVHRGVPGTYRIQANYYGSSQQTLVGPATVLATVFTNHGRPDEDRRTITVRVTEVKDVLDVGEVTLGDGAVP